MIKQNVKILLMLIIGISISGCIRYGFTGTSIPEGVNSIYIPFFANQTSSGVSDLSDRLNNVLIERFINQSNLNFANNRSNADTILEGSIVAYNVETFSITGDNQAEQNQVNIVVQATYEYAENQEQGFSKRFTGNATYDPNESPIEGEANAAQQALEQIANNIFNDAVSGW